MSDSRLSLHMWITLAGVFICVSVSVGESRLGHDFDLQDPDNELCFALVELFTSEGCSSCPPADQNLARIARLAEENDLPVYTLSLHVDYWNHLGWKDPFSRSLASQRQRQYAQNLQSNRIYTPQMVVNGAVEFVGSNRAVSNRQINAALQQAPKAKITITANQRDEGIEVSWRILPVHKGDVLNPALVQNRTRRQVTAGENTGRALTHVNVVRDLQTVRVDDASGRVIFALPQGYAATEYHLVAYVQCSDLRVLAATRSEIAIQGERNSLPPTE